MKDNRITGEINEMKTSFRVWTGLLGLVLLFFGGFTFFNTDIQSKYATYFYIVIGIILLLQTMGLFRNIRKNQLQKECGYRIIISYCLGAVATVLLFVWMFQNISYVFIIGGVLGFLALVGTTNPVSSEEVAKHNAEMERKYNEPRLQPNHPDGNCVSCINYSLGSYCSVHNHSISKEYTCRSYRR